MRIRRKKNLDGRIDSLSNVLVIDREKVNVNEAIADKKIIDFSKEFDNENPIDLEIGCGKGKFIAETALLHPERNFIAVDSIANILVVAAEDVQNKGIDNVRFLNTGAEYLQRYVDENLIERLYLNFSPPYPQSSYENRRLTNDRYLAVYKALLKPSGEIYFRTDDKGFFDYSFEKLKLAGFFVEDVSEIESEVKTEFELKFISQGVPVYKLSAKFSTK